MLVVVEGSNGIGKSIISKKVSKRIGAKYVSFPGHKDGTIGNIVHDIHEDPGKIGVDGISNAGMQVLHTAAHIDTIDNQIKPHININGSVILDRFWWSTVIYGRQYGVNEESLQAMIALEKIHWGGIQPDVVFLVDRPHPFVEETDEWSELRSRYLRFATEKEHPYPVEIMKNTSTVEDAVNSVIETIKHVTYA